MGKKKIQGGEENLARLETVLFVQDMLSRQYKLFMRDAENRKEFYRMQNEFEASTDEAEKKLLLEMIDQCNKEEIPDYKKIVQGRLNVYEMLKSDITGLKQNEKAILRMHYIKGNTEKHIERVLKIKNRWYKRLLQSAQGKLADYVEIYGKWGLENVDVEKIVRDYSEAAKRRKEMQDENRAYSRNAENSL